MKSNLILRTETLFSFLTGALEKMLRLNRTLSEQILDEYAPRLESTRKPAIIRLANASARVRRVLHGA